MDSLIILPSLFAPFLLWPIEFFFPYPFLVEEFLKAAFVFFGLGKKKKISIERSWGVFVLAGIAFTASETVIYSININLYGNLNFLFKRFLFTGLLHTSTFLILLISAVRGKKYVSLGLLINIFIHYSYNFYFNSSPAF